MGLRNSTGNFSLLVVGMTVAILGFSLWRLPTQAQELDGLLDEAEDLGELTLEDHPKVSQQDFLERYAKATAEPDPNLRKTEFMELLAALATTDQIVLDRTQLNRFVGELEACVNTADLRKAAADLTNSVGDPQFDLSARARQDLGIRLALIAGGATADRLIELERDYHGVLDLEWLLPALGRAAGPKALPILERYRHDAAIIPLANWQNIQRIPCAAILACAYAGDRPALDTVLTWYEQDVTSRPRFAFYVQWARQEGMDPKTSLMLLDYCEHRIRQAEHLLAFRGNDLLPELIQRANQELSLSLSGYLLRQFYASPATEQGRFLPLLSHPSEQLREQLIAVLLENPSRSIRDQVVAELLDLRTSQRGIDRLFAIRALCRLQPATYTPLLEDMTATEPNPAVRYRMQLLKHN